MRIIQGNSTAAKFFFFKVIRCTCMNRKAVVSSSLGHSAMLKTNCSEDIKRENTYSPLYFLLTDRQIQSKRKQIFQKIFKLTPLP